MNKGLVIFVALLALGGATSAFSQGLELYGRVYDGNAKYTSINDAYLEIIISGREPSITYPIKDKGSYRALEFRTPDEKNVTIQASHPDYIQQEVISFLTSSFKTCFLI